MNKKSEYMKNYLCKHDYSTEQTSYFEYTDIEKSIIMDTTRPLKEIAKFLKRPLKSVYNVRYELKHPNKNKTIMEYNRYNAVNKYKEYTLEEETIIRSTFNKPIREVCKFLGRSYASIATMRSRLRKNN